MSANELANALTVPATNFMSSCMNTAWLVLALWMIPSAHAQSTSRLEKIWLMKHEIQIQISEPPTDIWLVNLRIQGCVLAKVELFHHGSDARAEALGNGRSVLQWLERLPGPAHFNVFVDPDLIFGQTADVRKRLAENQGSQQEMLNARFRTWLSNQILRRECAELLSEW